MRGRVVGLEKGQPRYRLLIAEDQPENRILLHKILQPLGFDIREAVNGKEVVEIFEQWHPDLIWMDIRMPVMDGLEATRRIKKAAPGTRIVAITAYVLEDERREILAAGCDDFIRKPYRIDEILHALTKNLNVRFIYEKKTISAVAEPAANVATLALLPPKLLDALEQALVRLDIEAVNSAIEDIRAENQSLADVLAVAARDLRFGLVLQWLRDSRSHAEESKT